MKFPQKVAIVTETLSFIGGSDKLIKDLLKIFPKAVIFTSVYTPKLYPDIKNEIRTSFLNNPFLRKIIPGGRNINLLTPLAFESFDLREFDLVISVSAGQSKGVISTLDQKHIGIILTPPRHQWDREINIRATWFRYIYKPISVFIIHYLRIWDITAIKRVDHLVAISKFIQEKIKKRYRRDSDVIYLGIDDVWFKPVTETGINQVKRKYGIDGNYLLCASRLYDQKRIDWAIEACKRTGDTLVIVGTGPDKPYLQKLARGFRNIIFTDFVSDDELLHLYHGADAFLFPGIEDFGYVAVEAMACGTPVLAFNEGGVTETVKRGISGEFFSSIDELVKLIKKKVWKKYSKSAIIKRAQVFTEEKFINSFTKYLEKIYKEDKAK